MKYEEIFITFATYDLLIMDLNLHLDILYIRIEVQHLC